MQAGFGPFAGSSPSIEQLRNQSLPNGSPMQPSGAHGPPMPGGPAAFGGPPGFIGGFGGYGGMGGMPNVGYMQEQVNSRRGRVGRHPHRDGSPRHR